MFTLPFINAAICNKSKLHECKLHPFFYKKKKTLKRLFIIKPRDAIILALFLQT